MTIRKDLMPGSYVRLSHKALWVSLRVTRVLDDILEGTDIETLQNRRFRETPSDRWWHEMGVGIAQVPYTKLEIASPEKVVEIIEARKSRLEREIELAEARLDIYKRFADPQLETLRAPA